MIENKSFETFFEERFRDLSWSALFSYISTSLVSRILVVVALRVSFSSGCHYMIFSRLKNRQSPFPYFSMYEATHLV